VSELRNPFKLRASEHIASDETFVRFFSPGVLEIFNTTDIWQNPQIIRSAPGGGKTSLLRLFTPTILRTVYSLRNRETIKDLHKSLVSLNAINSNGPAVLGVILGCAQSYATLDDLNIDDTRKKRLFFSLVNSRIVLSILQGILDLFHADSTELRNLKIRGISKSMGIKSNSGTSLYEWAYKHELSVCEALDSFLPLSDSSLPGHDSIFTLKILGECEIFYKDSQINYRPLIMIDDMHLLTKKQRKWLLEEVINRRYSASIWLAERLEALSVDQLLTEGSSQGRDRGRVINIESFWSGTGKRKFEKMVSSIADRRSICARDVDITSFSDCLLDEYEGNRIDKSYEDAVQVVSTRVKQRISDTSRFDSWREECESFSGSNREKLQRWRVTEILIERELRKKQLSFSFMEYMPTELEKRDTSNIQAAAELFIAKEFNIPYFYGLPKLASLATNNIEQFLWLSGDLFEECVSAALLRKSINLSPKAQQRILKKSIKSVWRELPVHVKHGTRVLRFLESVGKLGEWETYKPTAPYAPGVTGVAISMEDRSLLNHELEKGSNEKLNLLGDVLATCIAHNLLEVKLNQKCKGQLWMVMYLNRMLCVHFELPLQYGGWRERRLHDLIDWMTNGFSPPGKKEDLFAL